MSILSFIVLIPFVSSLIIALIYLFDTKKERFWLYMGLGIAAPALSMVLSLNLLYAHLGSSNDTVFHSQLFDWMRIGDLHITLSFMADRLTVVMLSFITVVGTLIHIYAAGYMRGDSAFGKFFAFFNLFMGSMLLLILADNPIIMFIGWELVGLSSYLLIGYYHQDPANVKAANKAFILNRVGDFGFIIGLVLLFLLVGKEGFTFVSIAEHLGTVDSQLLSLVGFLLFVGAMGKSAQIPLYVWLPDAMAGPTPVSALIHAATMVTAGVYMVARFSFLYNEVPMVGEFIAFIGIGSSLFAALIALYQDDIKKILAYSTMSQLGYMFVAVGLGAYSSGIFHVFTHAFFKALLFMGAGAVIIALHHEQNIFRMGGLRKHLKVVYVTMFIATLAISGIPPFAGFFSKDAILVAAFASGHYTIWILGTLTAFLTALYMFRMLFIVFFNEKSRAHHLIPLSQLMTAPLIILAFGSATVGFLGLNEAYGGNNWFGSFLHLPDRVLHISHTTEYMLGALSVTMGVFGMVFAYKLYAQESRELLHPNGWQSVLQNKFYIDELYVFLFVKPLLLLGSFFENFIDKYIFDGFINGSVRGYRGAGFYFAQLQNGKVRLYALYSLIGLSLISLSILLSMGVN